MFDLPNGRLPTFGEAGTLKGMTGHDKPIDPGQHEELWQAVLRTAVDPIIVIDQEGLILRVNDATERLFGYSGQYLVGRNISLLMPEPYRSEHDGYLGRYLRTGDPRIIGIGREVEAQKADGEVFPIALAVSEIKWKGSSWFTGIIHDLSQRHEVEAQLRASTEHLEARVQQRTAELERSMTELARSNRDLEQFAYIASHDLQTPLRNVRQGLGMLDDQIAEQYGRSLDGEAAELRDLTIAAAERMERLIQGLLSYSRLDRTGAAQHDKVDLRVLAEELIGQMSVELAEVGATVEVGSLPAVVGDETQLRQLLQNLLENALKYRHPTRPLEIRIDATNGDDEDDTWTIRIGDNGIGIDHEQRSRVFELFRRAHPDYDGMGLGLAICLRIVERHGGNIWVDAGPDGGSVFTFTIPRTEVSTDDE